MPNPSDFVRNAHTDCTGTNCGRPQLIIDSVLEYLGAFVSEVVDVKLYTPIIFVQAECGISRKIIIEREASATDD